MRQEGAKPVGPPPETPDPAAQALEEAVGLALAILKGTMLLLGLGFLGSGFFGVESHEVGFVSRLGALTRPAPGAAPEPLAPGAHWGWPVLDQVLRVDLRVRAATSEAFDLYRTQAELLEGTEPTRQGGLDPTRDGYLLTGDANLLHVSLTARVKPQAPYHRARVQLQDGDAVVRALLERAAVRSAAHRGVDSLLTAGKADFLEGIEAELRGSLEPLGLSVEGVDLERDLRAPPQVRAAFATVPKASQRADGLRSEALAYAATVDNQAVVAAVRVEREAANRAKRTLAGAEADAALFEALLEEYRRNPRALEDRLLARTLAESLGRVGEAFLVGEGPLRIRLQRDVSQQGRAAIDQARRAARGEQ